MGQIRVSGELDGDVMVFRVWDNGMGMKKERLEHVRKIIAGEVQDQDDPSGFGLFNVDQRIRLNYGEEYGLEMESCYMEWTEARVRIPAVKI